jgi:hypothetical protein
MTEIRPARAADAQRLAGLLAQLGYPTELDAVTSRPAGILRSATRQVLVPAPPDDSRIDGYIGLERRLTLHQDEHVEITDLVVDDAGLDPAWIETALIPVLTDPGRIAAMSAQAPAADAPDADVVQARHVLTAVAERRRLAS